VRRQLRGLGAALTLTLGLLLVTSACSGTSRPSQSDVSQALQKGADNSVLGSRASTVSKKAADCIAKVLVGSNISDRALQAIVDGTKNYRPTKQDEAAAVGISSKIVKCLPAGLGN
jgi:hypothetical protein